MTNKKLIETLNYLDAAPANKLAIIHSKGYIIDIKKIYSICTDLIKEGKKV